MGSNSVKLNISQVLIDRVARCPNQPAIVEPNRGGERTITYAQLEQRSAEVAAILLASRLQKGDRVLLLQPMSIELYVVLLAIFRLGLVATVLDASAGRDHINKCCGVASPKALIGPTKAHLLRGLCPGLRSIDHHFVTSGWLPGATRLSRTHNLKPHRKLTPCGVTHDALLTFTSGSTNQPKAAMRSHGFLLAQYRVLAEAGELEAGEVALASLPIFVLANLASGVTTVIAHCDLRNPGLVKPEPILQQIERHNISRTEGSPAFYVRLLNNAHPNPLTTSTQEHIDNHHDTRLGTITKLFTGGAPVFPSLMQQLRSALPNGRALSVYGATEAEPITKLDWDEVKIADIEGMQSGSGLLVGKPVEQIQVRVVANQWGSPIPSRNEEEFAELVLPNDHAGEIVVSGTHVLGGYLNPSDDEVTKFWVDRGVWHRTGDTGYLDCHGRLWLLGRASAVITDGRGTLYPFAVEGAASFFAWVERSALLGRNGKRMLVLQLSSSAPKDALQQVNERLAWALLDQFVVLQKIPVDRRHNAKVDYPALVEELERRDQSSQ